VNLWPFIEVEEAEQHSVKRACELLEVSRAAYYEQRKRVPSRRALDDAELTERIKLIHAKSKHLRGAEDLRPTPPRRRQLRQEARCPSPRSSWSGRALPEALAHDHHRRSEHRGAGRRPHQAGLRARREARHPLVWRRDLHPYLGRLGVSGHGHRPGFPAARGLGPGRSHAYRPRRRRPANCLRSPSSARRSDLPFPTAAVSTPAVTTPPSPPSSASRCRWAARASAGTTPYRRAGSPRSRTSSSTPARGRPSPAFAARPSSSSRAGTTPAGSTAASATAARPSTKPPSPGDRRPSGMINTPTLSAKPG
jgi:hypothetical protein